MSAAFRAIRHRSRTTTTPERPNKQTTSQATKQMTEQKNAHASSPRTMTSLPTGPCRPIRHIPRTSGFPQRSTREAERAEKSAKQPKITTKAFNARGTIHFLFWSETANRELHTGSRTLAQSVNRASKYASRQAGSGRTAGTHTSRQAHRQAAAEQQTEAPFHSAVNRWSKRPLNQKPVFNTMRRVSRQSPWGIYW